MNLTFLQKTSISLRLDFGIFLVGKIHSLVKEQLSSIDSGNNLKVNIEIGIEMGDGEVFRTQLNLIIYYFDHII